MENIQIIELMNNPQSISSNDVNYLDEILLKYPYFQIAQVLLSRGLLNIDSIRFNQQLKKSAAYALNREKLFHLITKENPSESNTSYAQGGIAGVWDNKDDFEKHIADTLDAGSGLNNTTIVEIVVKEYCIMKSTSLCKPELFKMFSNVISARFPAPEGESSARFTWSTESFEDFISLFSMPILLTIFSN